MNPNHTITKDIAFAGGALSYYLYVPYDCTVVDVNGAVEADPGDGETITITENSAGTAIGVLTYGSTIAAAAVGTYTTDATNGSHKLVKGEVLKFVTSAAATANVTLMIELSPLAVPDEY